MSEKIKIKKIHFSTKLSDLYGRDNYVSHIELGRKYWWRFPYDSDVSQRTGKLWNELEITYIRSGCMFYIITEAPELGEFFAPLNCFMTASLVFSEFDPIKDLDNLDNEDIELCKMKWCFDDERTIIKNWPNERETEIDKDKFNSLNLFDFVETLFQSK